MRPPAGTEPGRIPGGLHHPGGTGTVPRMRLALFAVLSALCLAGCASTPARDSTTATYLLVRHAEKDVRVANDPPLTVDGQARAERLVALFAETPLDAIYSSPTRRTRQTATPVARAKQLTIVDYNPRDADAFAKRLRAEHPAGTVLVIGHSDTLPPLARALCGCAVADMDEAIYGIRYTIRFDAGGRARIAESRD